MTKPFKSNWPRVIRSPEVNDGMVLAIDGANFEDGMRRIVVGLETSLDGMDLIKEALMQIDFADQQRAWFESVLTGESNEGEKR